MAAALALLVAAAALLTAVLAGARSTKEEHPSRKPRVAAILSADGTPLASLPGAGDLLRGLQGAARGRSSVRTAVRPDVQRALVAALADRAGTGVVVEVSSGRLLAAAGSGGRSPWRTTSTPGAALRPVLAAAALDQPVVPRGAVRAEVRDSAPGVPVELAVRLGAWGIDDLLRRLGLGTRAASPELRALSRPGSLPGLEQPGVHGVGVRRQFTDARGRYRDAGRLTRVTTLQLAQLALASASDGRRTQVGVTRAGPLPAEPTFAASAGAAARRLLADRAAGGTVVALGGPGPADAGRSVIAFGPAGRPRVAVALHVRVDDASARSMVRSLLATASRADR